MPSMRIFHVVGARPNFMKVAPVYRALAARGVEQTLLHTGQHYDVAMSEAILKELGLPDPDVNLGVGSGTHAQQTAQVMLGVEEELKTRQPDLVIVYGDVNSTMAAALVAVKLGIAVAHVEAGLRSGDRSMPEEINRLVTDRVSQWLFTCLVTATTTCCAKVGGRPDQNGRQRHGLPAAIAARADGEQYLRASALQNGSALPCPGHAAPSVERGRSRMLARLFAALDRVARHVPVVFSCPSAHAGADDAIRRSAGA